MINKTNGMFVYGIYCQYRVIFGYHCWVRFIPFSVGVSLSTWNFRSVGDISAKYYTIDADNNGVMSHIA